MSRPVTRYQFSPGALEQMTPEQRDAVISLAGRYRAERVDLALAFDLPDGYLGGAVFTVGDLPTLVFGVDPEGAISS